VPADPIRDDELDAIFGGLTAKTLLLAVSGGSDSVALLRLAERWRTLMQQGAGCAPDLVVATVDHRLRTESRAEAQWVERLCKDRALAHRTLVWETPRADSNLQEAARDARYDLLRTLAATLDNAAIVTAHHLDDQAETVLMRLARGSGLDGLTGMQRHQGSLIRPLLAIPKARLLATLAALGQDFLEDPSNANLAFERVRLRAIRSQLEDAGLTPTQIARSAHRLNRARDALDRLTTRCWEIMVHSHEGAFASIDLAALSAEPVELQVRLLQRALAAWSGGDAAHLLSKAEALVSRLEAGPIEKQTLAGCTVWVDDRLFLCREWGRNGLAQIELAPGETRRWDGRFDVSLGREAAEAMTVRALGNAGLHQLKSILHGQIQLPAEAALTLPSFWLADLLVAVPYFGFVAPGWTAKHKSEPPEHIARFVGAA
jgi:tRNA(Ile)-lysidine synthase